MPTLGVGLRTPHKIAFADDPEDTLVRVDDWDRADPALQQQARDLWDLGIRLDSDYVRGHYIFCPHFCSPAIN
jgi:hypothetical protein